MAVFFRGGNNFSRHRWVSVGTREFFEVSEQDLPLTFPADLVYVRTIVSSRTNNR
jgi:hypothetical protein